VNRENRLNDTTLEAGGQVESKQAFTTQVNLFQIEQTGMHMHGPRRSSKAIQEQIWHFGERFWEYASLVSK
jgi:hypothetical protein